MASDTCSLPPPQRRLAPMVPGSPGARRRQRHRMHGRRSLKKVGSIGEDEDRADPKVHEPLGAGAAPMHAYVGRPADSAPDVET